MNIDKKTIMQKLEGMDEKTLREAVMSLAKSAGVSTRRAEEAVSDLGKLRDALSDIGENEIKAIVNYLGEEKMKALIDQFNSM